MKPGIPKSIGQRCIYGVIMVLQVFLISCATPPQILVSRSETFPEGPIRSIALMPSGGALADAIGIELLNYGFEIIDTGKLTNLMIRFNLTEIEITQPQHMVRLADDGIDTILLVKSVAGYDNRPQSASVKVVLTRSGKVIGGATWQNGKGGAPGSHADQSARVDLSAAANQIASSLCKVLSNR